MSDRQKLFYALLASAFFHLAAGLILATWPTRHSSDVARTPPDLAHLTVTIMPPKLPPKPLPKPVAPVIAAAPKQLPHSMRRPVLDSDGLTRSSKAPANPVFQSDSNMVAGSQLPASGNLPLPSEAGPSRKFTDFADQAATFGKGQTPIQAAPERPSAPSASNLPEQSPYGITRVRQTPVPRDHSTPAPTPRPTPVPTAAPDILALGKPTPTPAPASQLPTPIEQLARLANPPSLRGHVDMAPMPAANPEPAVARRPEPSMRRETEKTHVNGGITAPGAPGVNAVETPYGRYQHKIENLVGSRWVLYIQEHPTNVGKVRILFKIRPNGTVDSARVLTKDAPLDLAQVSTKAIEDSQLPPVPDDLVPTLRDGKLEVTFDFTYYDPTQ